MQRFPKLFVWLAMVAALALSNESARAYSLEGPIGNNDDAYQVPSIAYGLPGDLSAPKKIGQEYRRNTPIMYYAADASFLNFFGNRGMTEVDKAYAIFNNLTNVSLYSPDLSEFPPEAQLVNQRAASLFLTDLKSVVLGSITEQLGLFQPARAVWALRARVTSSIPCPLGVSYDVIKRNIGITPNPPDQSEYSSYVNDTLYSYFIYEDCGAPPEPDADAVEFPVDPLADIYTAVADYFSFWYDGLNFYGGYYTGLTRDDVGGMRYLLGTNNFNFESSGPGTVEFETNAQPILVTNLDLAVFSAQALTNPPAALTTLYPGLLITSVSNTFAVIFTTNITATLVTSPYDPAGFPPTHPLFTTNIIPSVITIFHYTFGNVVTNQFATRGLVGTLTFSLTNSPFSVAGTPPTIVTKTSFSFVNGIFGNFYILPTNFCASQVLTNILTQVIATTNFPTLLTTGGTNGVGGGTNTAITFVPGSITFFTNQNLVVLPVSCPADTVATRRGVEKLTFLRRDFDSLINQFWDPATNDYTLYSLTNGTVVPEHIRRIVTQPDFLYSGTDLGGRAGFVFARNLNFNQANTPTNAAGPGTIETPTQLLFNDTTPIYFNAFLLAGANFLGEPTEASQIVTLIWASFDGSTNEPVVYPDSVSISDLENMLLGPSMGPPSLVNGQVGVAYSAQLVGSGGQPPYTFSLAPGSALPSGLNLSPDGLISGTPDGPAATYDFVIRITDSNGAFRDSQYTLTIDP
jgi:hypothetical protein